MRTNKRGNHSLPAPEVTRAKERLKMKITKETVVAVVTEMKATGKPEQEIENNFKAALKNGLVDVDIYCMAMEEIYR